MTQLYPLKFSPILKERVWGGKKISETFGKGEQESNPIGESWEISGVEDDISLVSNGFLAGNDINELVETYLGDLVGDDIYERYGNEFPLLIKILDIKDYLSLQIHPDDVTAMERHNSYGKTECWYILECEPEAKIYLGLSKEMSASEFYDRCKDNSIKEFLNVITPKIGDIIYIKPGTLHAATGGILVAEIQQVSDITYRVYDWGREHDKKSAREMHLDLAIDCINYSKLDPYSLVKSDGKIDTPYFKINKLAIKGEYCTESTSFNSFIIYFCIEGSAVITNGGHSEKLLSGENILIPASMGEYKIKGECLLLEITGVS